MKSTVLISLFCILGGASAGADGKDHPVVKVIDLVKSLKEKAISEGKEEAVAYTTFTYWCSTNMATLKEAIGDENEKIDELQTKISGLTKEKASLEEQITILEDQITKLEASGKASKENRDAGSALYSQADADLGSTISAVDACIKALEEAESSTEAEAAEGAGAQLNMLARNQVKKILTLKKILMTKSQRHGLEVYVAGEPKEEKERPTLKAEGDMEAHVDKYDFKSENVIELLKQLKLKFEDDKLAGTKAETNAVNAYDLSKQARDDSIQAAKDSKDKKDTELASTESAIAEAESSLKDTKDDLAADSQSLADVEESCSTKKSEWEARSKTRTQEVEAMDAAIKILSKSTGVRSEAPENPVPPTSPVVFLQVASSVDPKMKAITLLREAAKNAHSKALERLAVEVQAHLSGPFNDVNNMIEKMIFRLMDEQKKEDEHKFWCDEEIKKTDTMKENKEDKIADLKAEIESLSAKVTQLASDIEEDNKMIADVDTFMQQATEIRNVGKKENALAVKDSKDAQASLTNAIAVITTFYKESGEVAKEPWEFIQEPVKLPEDPKTWDSPYTGVADPKQQPGGIISVLETVLSDFEKMEAETTSQETVDQKEYDESMKSSKIEKARRTQEVEMKSAERSRKVDKVTSLSSQKKQTEAGLEKTDQYLKDLKPACVDGDSTWENRKAARTKEIEALKGAQIILLEAFKNKEGEESEQKGGKFLQISRHGALP